MQKIYIKSNGLKLGKITYVPDRRVNAVIAQQLEEEDIPAGEMIYKGSSINLVIGDGEGLKTFPAPNLGKTYEEVIFQIEASGLKLDDIQYVLNDTLPTKGFIAKDLQLMFPFKLAI